MRSGTEVIRAERLWLSPLDDRMVIEGAELRYITIDREGRERVFTVRGDRVTRQGPRFWGRDLSITSCTAGEPHFEVISGLDPGEQVVTSSYETYGDADRLVLQ